MGVWEFVLIFAVAWFLLAAKRLSRFLSDRTLEVATPRTTYLVTVLLALGFVFALLSLLQSLIR